MKETQVETNPFPFSDTNKRYYTYDYYLKKTFGQKAAKLPIDAGFTCPNIDGRCGYGGCIYCSPAGSGDFTAKGTVREQLLRQKELFSRKWNTEQCIAYFQAHTNTYADVTQLRNLYEEALSLPFIVGLNIATRPDCLPEETVSLLSDLANRIVLTVELGLQSSNDETAERIHRGHTFADFRDGFMKLRTKNQNIRIGAHIIFGLPGEGETEMMQTVRDIAVLHPDEVKIHLLHVPENTQMARLYRQGDYTPMTKEQYVKTVCDALELLPPDIVIGRLTGDGKKEDLLTPLWSLKKTAVINDIDKELYRRGSMQGKRAKT